MNLLDFLSVVLLCAGGFFFVAGTIGLLRFPDLYTRLHALTKVDNLGLGFVVLAMMLQADSTAEVLKLALIWALAIAASATIGYLVAQDAMAKGLPPRDKARGDGS